MEITGTKIWTRSFVLLFFSNLLMALAFYFLIAVLPMYIQQVLKAEKSEIGIALSMYTIAALLIRPFFGMALDRKGRKLIYLISLLVFAMMFNLYIVATTMVAMMFFRFLHGLSWGVTSISGSTVVVDIIPPEKRGEGIGYFGISMTLGMALGPFLGMTLLDHVGYDGVFVIGGLLAILSFVLAWLVRYPTYIPKPKNDVSLTKQLFEVSSPPASLTLLFLMTIYRRVIGFIKQLFEVSSLPASLTLLFLMTTYGSVIGFINLFAESLNITEPGLFFLPFALGIGIARVVAGRRFDLHGPKTITLLAIIIMATGFFFLSYIQNMNGFLAAGFLLGIGNGMLFPTFQAIVNNLAGPKRRGAANSTLFTAVDLGIGIGMVGAGVLSDFYSMQIMYAVAGCFALFSIIPFLFFTSPHYDRNYKAEEKSDN
ncbi:MAG: MFS transporter [Bacteroidota bacterium]